MKDLGRRIAYVHFYNYGICEVCLDIMRMDLNEICDEGRTVMGSIEEVLLFESCFE